LGALGCLGNLLVDVAPNGADRFAGYRAYKYFASAKPIAGSAQSRALAASRFSMRVFFSAEEMKGNVFFVPDDPAVMPRRNVK
jgi:hypothetical protein